MELRGKQGIGIIMPEYGITGKALQGLLKYLDIPAPDSSSDDVTQASFICNSCHDLMRLYRQSSKYSSDFNWPPGTEQQTWPQYASQQQLLKLLLDLLLPSDSLQQVMPSLYCTVQAVGPGITDH